MAWRNGGGTTTEVHAHCPTGSHFDWRVSIAAIAADGPFSRFVGYDRHIMTIEGAGFTLSEPEGLIDVAPVYRVRSFAGDLDVMSRLKAGPVRDYNLMVRRDRYESRLECFFNDEDFNCVVSAGWLLLTVLSGKARQGASNLEAEDSLLAESGDSLGLAPVDGPFRLAVCTIRPREPLPI